MAAGGPKAPPTKWTLVFSTKVMRFDRLQEAEAQLKKAQERRERAYIQPPIGPGYESGGRATLDAVPLPYATPIQVLRV
jgi:hypothetical protein